MKVYSRTAEESFTDKKVIDLCHAIEDNNKQKVIALIADGVNVNAVSKKSSVTPLIWAIWGQKPNMVKLLINSGADINKQREISKETPLKFAAGLIQFDIVVILLENGADPFIKDAQGYNLSYEVELHYKLRSKNSPQFKNILKTIEILKEKGMKLDLVRDEGE